jgi:hypothetical protein
MQEYECKICGKKFGDSLGDMQHHILIIHMEKADFHLRQNDTEKWSEL